MSEAAITYVTFAPSPTTPFQFQATLDGSLYTVIIVWNLGGQRWFFTVYDLSGNLQISVAMVGSPPIGNISLTAGHFTTSVVYRAANNQFEISG